MIVDENGKPKCEYIQRDGTTVVGDYDVIPLMDKFLEEHPDASYIFICSLFHQIVEID